MVDLVNILHENRSSTTFQASSKFSVCINLSKKICKYLVRSMAYDYFKDLNYTETSMVL